MSLSAFNGRRRVPPPFNDPIRSYAPGTPERASLKARLKTMAGEKIEIPLFIGGKEVKTGTCGQSVMPHDHKHVLGNYHKATEKHIVDAINAAAAARAEWSSWAFEDRAVTLSGSVDLINQLDRQAPPLPYDQRYLYPLVPREGVGATSVCT